MINIIFYFALFKITNTVLSRLDKFSVGLRAELISDGATGQKTLQCAERLKNGVLGSIPREKSQIKVDDAISYMPSDIISALPF